MYCDSKTPCGRILVYKHQVEYFVGLCTVITYFVIFTSPHTHPGTYKKKGQDISRLKNTHTHTNRYLKSDLKKSTKVHTQELLHKKYEFYMKNRKSPFFLNLKTFQSMQP
jgi:hypothetical protein